MRQQTRSRNAAQPASHSGTAQRSTSQVRRISALAVHEVGRRISDTSCVSDFYHMRATSHAELFSLAHWWAVFLAFGERMRSLASVLQSIALDLHLLD